MAMPRPLIRAAAGLADATVALAHDAAKLLGMQRLLSVALATLATLSSVCTQQQGLARSEQPNVLFVMADDLGYGDLSCSNPQSAYKTPRLDRMAAEGVVLTDFYSSANVCTPARAGLLTGRYPIPVPAEEARLAQVALDLDAAAPADVAGER